jgi:hypothetical protein
MPSYHFDLANSVKGLRVPWGDQTDQSENLWHRQTVVKTTVMGITD